MKTFGWKRLLSLVSATTMLLLMIFTVYPITALADVERTADLMSSSVTYETDDGATASLSADGQSIVVTATQVNASTGLCGVTIDFSQPTAFDMTALNGLLMSVQSSVPFKMAVRVIQVGGTQDEYAFPGSAESMGRYFPQSGDYVDAGVYQDVLMDLNGICASGNFSDKSCVAINRIRFVMSGTGTLTLSRFKAAVCEDTIATSLLPSSASAFTQHEANGSTITATAVGTGGYTLTPTNGSWPAVSYAQTVQASLNATLYYNLTVTGSCNPLLFFNGGTAASYAAGQAVTIGKLIDPSISGEDLSAGRYVGSVSIADLVTYYKNTLGSEAIDIVDSGMVTISCAKIFAVSSAVTVHELSVAEPEAVSGPLDLMPADVSAIDGLSYDDSGRLVYTASAAGTVTFPVEKYYDINTYNKLFATVSSTVGCDILVNGVGISTSSDAVTPLTSNLRGDWGPEFSWMSANFAEQAIQTNFIGSPNWNKIIPGNGMYYIKSVTLKLDGAGTMTVRGLRMDTASYVPTVDAVTLTVGQVKGAAGELVYLPVSLQSKQGIANMDATVHFDSSLLEPVQQTDASAQSVWALWNTDVIGSGSSVVCDSYYSAGTGRLGVSYICGTTGVNSAATGVLFTLAFRIKDTVAASTEAPVSLSVGELQVYNDIDPDAYGASSPTVNTESGFVLIDLNATTTTTTTTAATTTTTTASKTTTTTTVVAGAETVTFTVSNAQATEGDILYVPVSLDSREGICNMDARIFFDTTLLEPIAQEDEEWVIWNTGAVGTSSVLKGSSYSGGVIKVVYANASKNTAASGVLFTLAFRLKDVSVETATTVTATFSAVQKYTKDNPDAYGAAAVNTAVIPGNISIAPIVETTTTTTTKPEGITSVGFTIEDQDVLKGDVVAVPVYLESSVGVCNFSATLTFDSAKLTPVSQGDGTWVVWNTQMLGSSGHYFTSDYYAGASELYITYINGKENSGASGAIATVYFTVIGDERTTADVSLTIEDIQYYDSEHGDEYGGVTPSAVNIKAGTLTICPKITVEYYDTKDQLISAVDAPNNNGELTIPSIDNPPAYRNYSFIGWNITSQTENTIQVAPAYGYIIRTKGGKIAESYIYEEGGGHLLKSDYTEAYFDYVTDRNQSGNGLMGYDNRVQVVADAAPEGMAFAWWQDQNGNIVSYDESYTVFIPGNLTLTAVYVNEGTEIAKTPTVSMQIVRTDPGAGGDPQKGSISWVSTLNIADTTRYTIEEFGIYYSPYADYDQLTSASGTRQKVAAATYSVTSYQYSVTINKVASGKTRAAVAYLIYKDTQTGTTHTVYSGNFLSATMTSAS